MLMTDRAARRRWRPAWSRSTSNAAGGSPRPSPSWNRRWRCCAAPRARWRGRLVHPLRRHALSPARNIQRESRVARAARSCGADIDRARDRPIPRCARARIQLPSLCRRSNWSISTSRAGDRRRKPDLPRIGRQAARRRCACVDAGAWISPRTESTIRRSTRAKRLPAASAVDGPAVIEEPESTTIVVPAGHARRAWMNSETSARDYRATGGELTI